MPTLPGHWVLGSQAHRFHPEEGGQVAAAFRGVVSGFGVGDEVSSWGACAERGSGFWGC